MSAPPQTAGELITGKTQLVASLEAGCKPASQWRIGTEHEKFAFHRGDNRPLSYDEPGGIRDVLTRMQEFGWAAVHEGENLIALKRDGASVTLEPGGQIELSGAPLRNVHETCDEVNSHLYEMKSIGEELGFGLLGIGFQPKWPRKAIPWMPKGRYAIMRRRMAKMGTLGHDMMLRTATVQVNLDFASEADMVRKFRVGLALQPIATALFANSPFTEGKPNGFLSYRSHIWTDTDPERCGILPFVFEEGMGFEAYVDYMLDVPMYFVYRNGKYIDAAGQSFRDFLDGKLPALPGETARIGDWEDHITTAFPEVRLKTFLEMRGADAGPWKRICALPALWTGLMYDTGALDAAHDLVKDWSQEDHARLRADVPRLGLATPFGNSTILDLAREVVAIARSGLATRACAGKEDTDEVSYLDELQNIVDTGRTPAEQLLEAYEGKWVGSVDPVFEELAY
ncbi:MAG: glutamate--cysteine ligase [Alphaproteobacteria bacterium]|nr:glutamate--cysteine ligase [Alphaproteobacteria bacterium]